MVRRFVANENAFDILPSSVEELGWGLARHGGRSETFKFGRACAHVRRRKEAEKDERFAANVARHMLLIRRDKYDIARSNANVATFRKR